MCVVCLANGENGRDGDGDGDGDMMGWDGTGRNGMGWDGMEWGEINGMAWHGVRKPYLLHIFLC